MENFTKAEWEKFLVPYRHAAAEIAQKLNITSKTMASVGMHSPIERVEHRIKRVASILAKAARKKIPLINLSDQMQDIAGIRVICRFVDDVPRVAELLKQRVGLDFTWVEERDYVNQMKESGYRGYHCIVKYKTVTPLGLQEVLVEIQLRTPAMDQWAKAEHTLRYKYNFDIPEHLLADLIKSADVAFAQDEKMNKIRQEILMAEQYKNYVEIEELRENGER